MGGPGPPRARPLDIAYHRGASGRIHDTLTLSAEARAGEVRDTLLRLYRAVGERSVLDVEGVDPASPQYASIRPTTWRELLRHGWVDEVATLGATEYRLNVYGWMEGLSVSGDINSPEVTTRLERLRAALKGAVKGRGDDGTIELEQLTRDIQAPDGWVLNVVQGDLLQRLHPDRVFGVRVELTMGGGGWVEVPLDFGLRRL